MSFRTALAVRNLLFPTKQYKNQKPGRSGLYVVHYLLRSLYTPSHSELL
jgi:hypothetical protein